MDNVCHTLVGAAFGEAGLKKRTRFGTAALLVGSNLPDLDVLVFATEHSAVAFRRGWTHGIGAMLVLPLALVAVLWLAARWRPPRPGADAPPVHAGWLLALTGAGVASHLLLDYLNTYGIRLLTPFDWRWFYGDAVFIVDPWLWLALGGGVWLARRRRSPTPPRVALVVAASYILAMMISARAARATVLDVWLETHAVDPVGLMVGPAPLVPFAHDVIVDAGDHYVAGRFTWASSVRFSPDRVAKNADAPEVGSARASSAAVRGHLVWSRFPYWTLQPMEDGTRVKVGDMRFGGRGGARFSPSTVVPRSRE
jgi:inner membrane protein